MEWGEYPIDCFDHYITCGANNYKNIRSLFLELELVDPRRCCFRLNFANFAENENKTKFLAKTRNKLEVKNFLRLGYYVVSI